MSEVKRYDCGNGNAKFCQGCYTMEESEYGEYVRAEDYDAALAELAALKGGRDDADLADRMKAAGMLSVAELLAGQPLDAFHRHAGVHDLATFAQWLEMRRTECLKMHARFQLEGREDDDELYEWVIAHAAVFGEVHINFKAAMEAPPAQASAWVAVPCAWVRIADDRPGAVLGGQVISYRSQTEKPTDWGIWEPLYASKFVRGSAVVPEGYAIVPQEPTPDMVRAALSTPTRPEDVPAIPNGWTMNGLAFRTRYRAALAAAPTPGASDGTK